MGYSTNELFGTDEYKMERKYKTQGRMNSLGIHDMRSVFKIAHYVAGTYNFFWQLNHFRT